jgi:SPOR domain
MIGDRSLVSTERPTAWLTTSDDRDGDDIQAAEIGEPYEADEYHDDPATPRWRYHLVMVIAVIALAGLGAVGAFVYRVVSAGAVMPALPPTMKAENATNENIQNEGDNRPSDLSQTSIANAGSSEAFVSRFPADIQEPPKTGTISPDPSASPPSAFGSAVAALATTPPTPPSSVSPSATSVPPKVASPVPAPSSSTPKKIKTAISRSDGSGQTDTSAATATSPAAKPSAAAAAPPVGMPLSLAPDAHDHSATSSPSRARMPAGTGTTAEASSGGGYEVAVASERSAADADAVFRSMQAKFPNQLGGREPIVRRTVLGPEGYRASIGPFVSMKAAARVCSSLKAAGESCLVEKN